MKVGVVFPVVYSDELIPVVADEYRSAASAGTELTFFVLTQGTPTIESELDVALNLPGVLAAASRAGEDHDAVVIACTNDPALHAVKELLSVPVVGEGEAALHLASMVAARFSIVTPGPESVPAFERLGEASPLRGQLASVRAVAADVMNFGNHCLGEIVAQSTAAIIEDGAQAIVMGCTGAGVRLAAVVADALESELERYVPVVDPIQAAVGAAEWMVHTRLRPSAITYPTPRFPRSELVAAFATGSLDQPTLSINERASTSSHS